MFSNFLKTVLIFIVLVSVCGHVRAQQPSAEQLFADGQRLLQEQRYEEALAAFKRSSELAPDNAAALGNVGAVNMNLGRHADAEAAFRKAIGLDPDFGEFSSGLCLALTAQRKFTDALKACEDGVRLEPGSAFARHAQIQAEAASGKDGRRLMSLIDLALAKFNNDENLLSLSADIAIFTKNFGYALELLQRLVSLDPDQARYHGRLAEVQLHLGEDAAALASARRALSLDDSNPYGNYSMGLILLELGANEEAAASFGRVPRNTPYLERSAYFNALSEKRRGRFKEAVEILRPLVEEFPNDPAYVGEFARCLLDAKLYREAIPAFVRAIKLDPADPVLLVGLGNAHMATSDFENAVRYFDAALQMKPGDEVFQMFANVARSRQQIPGRVEQMIRYVGSRPEDVQSRVALIEALIYVGRAKEADKYVEEVYSLDPSDPKIYQFIGVAYSDGGLEEKALAAHQRSLSKGEYEGAYLGIAGIMHRRGDIEAAAAAYEKVIELKPNVPNIMILYANMLRDNGKRREALAIYQRSLALQPSNSIALFNAGMLSLKLGQSDAAKVYLESLRPIDPRLASQLQRCILLNIWK